MNNRPSFSNRTRLAALIALLFVVSSAVLLTGQWLIVRHLLGNELSITFTTTELQSDGTIVVIPGEFTQTATQISDNVLRHFANWSLGTLAVATGLSVLAAWWFGNTIDRILNQNAEIIARQDRFIAGASHELRTPLTTARTVLEIPLSQGRVPPELQPAIQSALAANAKSEQLVTALLMLAQSKHLPIPDNQEQIDLASFCDQLLIDRTADTNQLGIRIEKRLSSTTITTDPDLLSLAVGNLIDNAIKHNRPGGTIYLKTGNNNTSAYIEVANDGEDLTGTDVDALKEPFHRGTHSRLTSNGLGLGLTLADSAAAALGGNLTLESRATETGGLTARLTLPRTLG